MADLVPHPDHPPGAVRSVSVHVGRLNHGYRLYYFLAGDIDRIVVPQPARKPERTDDLWQSTVFEAFIKGEGHARAAPYCEFNFAPSGDWAAYAFDHYRGGRRSTPTVIDIRTDRLANLLTVEAQLHADFSKASRLGLSAVVEEKDGTKSYWALAHPPGKPDFHDDTCFAMRLADIASP